MPGKLRVLAAALLVVFCGHYLVTAEDTVLQRFRRLIHGEPVPQSKPWMAVLAYKNSRIMDPRPYMVVCGAVLIDRQHVISTAHCFDADSTPARDGATLFVVLGLKDNSWDASNGDVQTFALNDVDTEVIMHPEYRVADVFEKDIALIKLLKRTQIDDSVFPALLPPANLKQRKLSNCQFFGWGVTGERYEGGLLGSTVPEDAFAQYLSTSPMNLRNNRACNRFYLNFLNGDHICAVGGAHPCFGDSGSPLFCDFKGKTYLVGLNSFRRRGPCEQNKAPQVYTRITEFLTWIEDNTRDDEAD